VTGRTTITYLGHSEGTTLMFYALSRNQTFWKANLAGFIALAPLARLDGSSLSIITEFAANLEDIKTKCKDNNIWSISGPFEPAKAGESTFCSPDLFENICKTASGVADFDKDIGLDDEMAYKRYMERFPSGTSI